FVKGKSFKEYVEGMTEIYKLLFKAEYDEYKVNRNVVKRIERLLNGKALNVLVLAAEWCPDSRRNVPALARIADYISLIRLSIHEVNKGDELSTKFGLVKIPTIIIYDENWVELGRIIENPLSGSIEMDLEKILSSRFKD
ncbi:MAG: thioredoxin family protein, partial [Thermoprotei archaeon]